MEVSTKIWGGGDGKDKKNEHRSSRQACVASHNRFDEDVSFKLSWPVGLEEEIPCCVRLKLMQVSVS